MKSKIRSGMCVIAAALAAMTAVAMAQSTLDAAKAPPKIELKAKPFALDRVRILPGPFEQASQADQRYLLSLDQDRLLYNFRANAGLPTGDAQPLGGWESPTTELRGHFIGHYLSALAMAYASIGDAQFKDKAARMVEELAKVQAALGPSGYLSAYPESFIERAEKREQVWAPYYTLHKIFAGLEDVYVYCGDARALEVVKKMGDWAIARNARLSDDPMQAMLERTEQGGMNDALSRLYALTGEDKYLAIARRFDEKHYTEPLANREDKLKGEHVNSFIPNVIGAAREYELTGDERLRGIATFFWNQVVGARSYANGGTSDGEHWAGDPYHLAQYISRASVETCCTYNMLKLTRHLFSWDPRAAYMDYYERALYNHILASIEPATGMTMYYTPFIPGLFKTFGTPNDSFWCCTGSGVENHVKYGDTIYYHDDAGLFVNLFIPSTLDWKERGIQVTQETRFPEEDATTLRLKTSGTARFAIRLRIPYWAAGATVKVNGQPQSVEARPSSYVALEREWKDGDTIELTLPMKLHLAPMPDDARLVALMYGPLVLAGRLGSEGVTAELEHGTYSASVLPAAAPLLVSETRNPESWLRPVAGRPLTWRTAGVGRPNDVEVIPFHLLFGERTMIYWQLLSEAQYAAQTAIEESKARAEEARLKTIDDRTLARVTLGDGASERAANLKSESSRSRAAAGRDPSWRSVTRPGWFSCEHPAEGASRALMLMFVGGAYQGGSLDVFIDNRLLKNVELPESEDGMKFEIEVELPSGLMEGKSRITVKIAAPAAGRSDARVHQIRLLRAAPNVGHP